ncbi:TetR/AcrR family transcriptional regulator [Mycobacterium barrassiae]|uniref:TetR/AcrR family transcriptional regulator n=1 Tax=Mycobacterium barrassiae TaxID=319709 RepID=UPI002265E5AF|nr:TetR/AcrR family transcriptional regulator [Mycobacterium barrassiae]MCV7301693.1 TetR/AcrR family transcriptional regulator [Mycobacterium barrassiae]
MTADSAPSRRELQRAASVARIVTAGEELLAEADRFSDISVEQVISRARVSRSTFYSYFDDMGHLLRAVGESVVGEIVESARKWMDLDTGVTQDELVQIFTDLVQTYRRRATLLAALADASAYDPGVRKEFHRLLTIGHVELAKHIRRAQAAGGARASIDPEPTAAWLVWMVERGLYQQIRPADADGVPHHVAALAAIVWHALYAPETGSPRRSESR